MKQILILFLLLSSYIYADNTLYNKGIKLLEENKLDKAVIAFKKASHIGNAKAMLKLGLIYEKNDQNKSIAIHWYKKAKKHGNKKALYNLGTLSCRMKTYTYLHDFEKFAKNNKKSVQYDLAICFEKKGNKRKAKKWFNILADKGYSKAQYRLAMLSNSKEKIHWLRKAAKGGSIAAEFDLGKLLFKQRKIKNAKIWLKKAKKHGSKKAAIYLKRINALNL